MKDKILTTICTLMVPVPWTILYLRSFAWALESPAAEITISCYCIFMIFSGLFTILSYFSGKAQNTLMKICLVINGIYAMGGVALFAMMIFPGVNAIVSPSLYNSFPVIWKMDIRYNFS